MISVDVEMQATFECPDCGETSQTDPGTTPGKTVVCEKCGRPFRVRQISYPVIDWNTRNRQAARNNWAIPGPKSV